MLLKIRFPALTHNPYKYNLNFVLRCSKNTENIYLDLKEYIYIYSVWNDGSSFSFKRQAHLLSLALPDCEAAFLNNLLCKTGCRHRPAYLDTYSDIIIKICLIY